MYIYHPYILGIMDKINEWNEKLNNFAGKHMDNVWVGAACMGIILLVAFWGVNTLNKK